ncbi:MAG: glycosyltransferase family 4 protein [Anaerolineales bacterium]
MSNSPMFSKPVRVLHIITRMIVGGAQENTMYTAALLDKDLFHVDLLCGPQTGSEGSLIEETHDLKVNLTILPELVREVNPWKDIIALLKLYRYIKQGNYAIVHTHSSKAGILGRLAAKIATTPVIIHTVHGWSFHDYMPWLKKTTYIFLERIMGSFCQKIIVVSCIDQEKGLKNHIGKPEQYQLIRSAIPLDKFQPRIELKAKIRQELGIPINAPVVGNIGRLSPQKNPLEWVQIAALIKRQIPNVHFLLVGDGPLHAQVVEQLQNEGILNVTHLSGLRRDVNHLLNAIDVFLLTSLWEGLPRVIPEAMCIGIPVVAYQVDGIAEIIRHGINGFLCEPHQLEKAAEYCVELIKNPSLRQSMINASRQSIQSEFDLNKMIQNIQQLYLANIQERIQ